jgi:hypothetical protein
MGYPEGQTYISHHDLLLLIHSCRSLVCAPRHSAHAGKIHGSSIKQQRSRKLRVRVAGSAKQVTQHTTMQENAGPEEKEGLREASRFLICFAPTLQT